MVVQVVMTVVMKMVGPVLRARPTNAECREAERHLEEALPRLTGTVPHLRLVVGFLEAFLRRVADVVTLVNVVHVPGVISHL